LKTVDGLLAGRTDLIGVTHLSGGGEASWADLAEATFGLLGGDRPLARVRRIATEDYPVAAARPKDSRLDNQKLAELLDWEPPHWRVGLGRCLAEIDVTLATSR
jgi:dTDP-4-dehydrorhamnose reductase